MKKNKIAWRVKYLVNGEYTSQYFTSSEFNLARTCINYSDDKSAEVKKIYLTEDEWKNRFY